MAKEEEIDVKEIRCLSSRCEVTEMGTVRRHEGELGDVRKLAE